MMDSVTAELYDPFSQGGQSYLGALDLEIGFASTRKVTDTPYDQDMLAEYFIKLYENQLFAPGQSLVMDHKSYILGIKVTTVQLVDLSMEKAGVSSAPVVSSPQARGILTRHTRINFFKDAKSPIKLKGSTKRPAANSIIAPDFKFENLGIGGLDTEFSSMSLQRVERFIYLTCYRHLSKSVCESNLSTWIDREAWNTTRQRYPVIWTSWNREDVDSTSNW